MGYSLFGRFVDVKNKKVIAEGFLDFMKSLSDMRYSPRFENVTSTSKTSTGDFEDIFDTSSADFVEYAPLSLLDDDIFKNNPSSWKISERKESYGKYKRIIVDEKFYEENKDVIRDSCKKMNGGNGFSFDMNSDDVIMIFVKKRESVTGMWYRMEDFMSLKDKLDKELSDKRAFVDKLKAIRHSADYYNMSEDAKNTLLSDIDYETELLDDLEWDISSVEKLLNLFSFIIEDMCFEAKDADGVRQLVTCYDDNRDVELFVEVY